MNKDKLMQFRINFWNSFKKIFCYYTGLRLLGEKLVRPWKKYDRLIAIPMDELANIIKDEKIKLLIIDMDGTIKHHKKGVSKENINWIREMEKHVKVVMISNANDYYVEKVVKKINIDYLNKAKKPSPKGFITIMNKYSCTKDEVIVIGDSIKSDYIGAKRSGIKRMILLKDLCMIDK